MDLNDLAVVELGLKTSFGREWGCGGLGGGDGVSCCGVGWLEVTRGGPFFWWGAGDGGIHGEVPPVFFFWEDWVFPLLCGCVAVRTPGGGGRHFEYHTGPRAH